MRRVWLLTPVLLIPAACQGFVNHCAYLTATRAAGSGDLGAAVAEMDGVLAADPTCKRATLMRATYKRKRGDHAGAVADYTRYLDLDPAEAVVYVHRADTRLEALCPDGKAAERAVAAAGRGVVADLIADYDRAAALDPTISRAYGQRALLRLAARDDRAAAADTAAFARVASGEADRRAFDEQVTLVRVLRDNPPPAAR